LTRRALHDILLLVLTPKHSTVYELSLVDKTNPQAAPLLSKLLENSGVNPLLIGEHSDGFGSRASVYIPSLKEARKEKNRLANLRLKRVSLCLKPLHKKDWIKKGKENFKPFFLTRYIEAIPAAKKN